MRSGSGQRPPHGRYNANRPVQQQPRSPQRNHTLDSHGPNIRIRGSAHQIFERYIALAREAATADDRVAAENFYQHAEHYFRIANANRSDQPEAASAITPADPVVSEGEQQRSSETDIDLSQPGWGPDRPGFV